MTTTECNGCGQCCNPVVLDLNYYLYAMSWAGEPDPDEAEPGYYDGYGQDMSDPAVVSKMREHIANGQHFVERFKSKWMTQSGVALLCDWFDPDTRRCTHYEKRPPVCRGYPWYTNGPHLEEHKGLPPLCSFWEDIELRRRPKDWKPISETEMQAMIARGEVKSLT